VIKKRPVQRELLPNKNAIKVKLNPASLSLLKVSLENRWAVAKSPEGAGFLTNSGWEDRVITKFVGYHLFPFFVAFLLSCFQKATIDNFPNYI
jgi:hypothetical protein